jgi:hypothetical protein
VIIKVELFEGKAYLLDEAGNIWKVIHTYGGIEVNIHKIYRALPHEVNEFMIPELARYDK